MTYFSAITTDNARTVRLDRARVSSLLARYPHLGAREKNEILTFLKTGRHIEIGLLMADKKMQPSLDRFMADHDEHFPPRLHPGVAIAFAVALTVALLGFIEVAVS